LGGPFASAGAIDRAQVFRRQRGPDDARSVELGLLFYACGVAGVFERGFPRFKHEALPRFLFVLEPSDGQACFVGVFLFQLERQRAGPPSRRGGEFAVGLEDFGRDHGRDQVSFPAWLGINERRNSEGFDGGQDGLDVAVGLVFGDGEAGRGGNELFALEQPAEAVQDLGAEGGKIGRRSLFDLPVFAEGLSEEDCRSVFAVGNCFEVHNDCTAIIASAMSTVDEKIFSDVDGCLFQKKRRKTFICRYFRDFRGRTSDWGLS
jgi:hypothetical protein